MKTKKKCGCPYCSCGCGETAFCIHYPCSGQEGSEKHRICLKGRKEPSRSAAACPCKGVCDCHAQIGVPALPGYWYGDV